MVNQVGRDGRPARATSGAREDRPGASILLGAARIRELAEQLGVRPSKSRGQNFVVDANTVRRIVRLAQVDPTDTVLEVGPGLGSLTLALLPHASVVIAVEVDPVLAQALPLTVQAAAPALAERLVTVQADAMRLHELAQPPTALVANLPYNVAVPVLLTLLQRFDSIASALVMVQLEVAQRLAASPGGRVYGAPSAKAAWYGSTNLVGTVPRSVFWPAPNVDSGLVRLVRRPPPPTSATRAQVFAVVDAAFAQRRKTLRAALAPWAGSAQDAERIVRNAGIDPGLRGERLGIEGFAAIAAARSS